MMKDDVYTVWDRTEMKECTLADSHKML